MALRKQHKKSFINLVLVIHDVTPRSDKKVNFGHVYDRVFVTTRSAEIGTSKNVTVSRKEDVVVYILFKAKKNHFVFP